MEYVKGSLKAIVGGVIAGLGAAQVALNDSIINASEGLGIAIAAIVAWQGIYWTPNKTESGANVDQPPAGDEGRLF